MSQAELVALRDLVAYLDFLGELPSRDRGEDLVVDAFIRAADPMIPELGTDDYGAAVQTAWRQITGD